MKKPTPHAQEARTATQRPAKVSDEVGNLSKIKSKAGRQILDYFHAVIEALPEVTSVLDVLMEADPQEGIKLVCILGKMLEDKKS